MSRSDQLMVVSPRGHERIYFLQPGTSLTLGRSSGNDIVLRDREALVHVIQAAQAQELRLTVKRGEGDDAEEGRTTNNYHFDGDTDALAEALDPAWDGPLPHTVLIAPGGEIIHRHTGEVDHTELRRVIVGRLGRFYSPK